MLINDFFLKALFHNFLTGKLSDFAGLFVFSLFWTAFFPKRKFLIFSLITVFFTFWKSPFSSGFIDAWNSIGLFGIGRTIDFTDLIAFSVLPLAWIYSEKSEPILLPKFSQNFALTAIALISVFAFTATSPAKPTEMEEYNETYKIEKSSVEILKKLQEFETDEFYETRRGNNRGVSFTLSLREKVCDGKPNASFEVSRDGNNSQIKLQYINYECKEKLPDQRDKLKVMFENEVLGFLKSDALN